MGSVTGNDSIYDFFMYPLERRLLRNLRAWLIPQAEGRVLEVGTGTGANIPFYSRTRVKSLTLTDHEVRQKPLRRRLGRKPGFYANAAGDAAGDGGATIGETAIVSADAESLPFPDHSFDTVVSTLVFCSVPDPEKGLWEIRRVLRPGGSLLFIEHVLPLRPSAAAVFNLLTPVWRQVASGCHLNRRTMELIGAAGFVIQEIRYRGKDIFAAGRALRD